MQTIELSLFNPEDQYPQPARQKLAIIEEKIITPLIQVIEQANPAKTKENLEHSQSFTQSLDNLFPEQQYDDKNIKKAKAILGSVANELEPELLSESVAEMQFLAKSWLDEFERTIFDGKTLNELLNEKGGV